MWSGVGLLYQTTRKTRVINTKHPRDMPAHYDDPSMKENEFPHIETGSVTYFDNLPPSRKFIIKLFFHPSYGSNINTLLNLVVSPNTDLARLGISEHQNFLCHKGDQEYRDIIIKNFCVGNLKCSQRTRQNLEILHSRRLDEYRVLYCH